MKAGRVGTASRHSCIGVGAAPRAALGLLGHAGPSLTESVRGEIITQLIHNKLFKLKCFGGFLGSVPLLGPFRRARVAALSGQIM